MTGEPTVFVIDDDAAVRRFLRGLIDSINLCVEVYDSAQAFLDSYTPGQIGCILLDIRMPGMSGLELQRELAKRTIDLPCIILTGHGDVQIAVQAMKNGAVDFIEKPFNNELLLDSVQRAIGDYMETRHERAEHDQIIERVSRLTPREREVLHHLVEGKTNKGIARSLEISEKTVEKHRGRVMEKMQTKSLASLVKMVAGLKGLNKQ
jgi:FixJ family two-component response regulator